MDPYMQHVPPAPESVGTNGHASAALHPDEVQIKPRQAVMARHKFRLEHPGSDALVRHIPLARLLTLTGLSPSMLTIASKVFDIVNGTDLAEAAAGDQLDLLRKNDTLV